MLIGTEDYGLQISDELDKDGAVIIKLSGYAARFG